MLSSLNNRGTKKVPQDLVALDFGTSGLKAIRVKNLNGKPTLISADILPPIKLGGQDAASDAANGRKLVLDLPPQLTANYAALAISGERAVVRVVTLPGHLDQPSEAEKDIRAHVGLDASFRVRSVISPSPRQKTETRLLAVAVPEADAKAALSLVAVGAPAPYSLEISGVAALNAALMGPVARHPNGAVAVLDCGATTSMLAIFNKQSLVLARKLDVGGLALLHQIQRQFNVDAEMAMSIVSQGAIDVTAAVKTVIDPFIRQLTISRDFVERQENCRVDTAYISGGMSLTPAWIREIARSTKMDVKPWDPLADFAMAPGAFPDRLADQQARFAAAVGAAMGVFQEPPS